MGAAALNFVLAVYENYERIPGRGEYQRGIFLNFLCETLYYEDLPPQEEKMVSEALPIGLLLVSGLDLGPSTGYFLI